jgi:ApbE superfamily uncharacterized protein (UPF0280 family)
MTAQRALLPQGRWHFQHGPIDIVIGADGDAQAVAAAHEAAWQRFVTILDELVAELPTLRLAVRGPCPLQGVVARRMWWACRPHHAVFITPMAAVAGAVAQELIGCYENESENERVTRAWVNNGGDIALHLAPGQSLRVGLYADLARIDAGQLLDGVKVDGFFDVSHAHPVRGVATSGWRGRSFSLGIADSVTVLARSAAEADAAATVIANAVTIDDARIVRRPACDLKDDTDLGDIKVTVDVPQLGDEPVRQALLAGQRRACELRAAGLIWSAVLVCQGQVMSTDESMPARLDREKLAPALGSVFA